MSEIDFRKIKEVPRPKESNKFILKHVIAITIPVLCGVLLSVVMPDEGATLLISVLVAVVPAIMMIFRWEGYLESLGVDVERRKILNGARQPVPLKGGPKGMFVAGILLTIWATLSPIVGSITYLSWIFSAGFPELAIGLFIAIFLTSLVGAIICVHSSEVMSARNKLQKLPGITPFEWMGRVV